VTVTASGTNAWRMPEVRMQGPRPFPPRVSAFTQPFWEALGRGRLVTTQCGACASRSFPPRNLCRHCWSQSLRWVDLSPVGTLYSFTRVHVAPARFRADTPYAIGIVDLADGVRLMCRMVGEVDATDLDGTVEMVVLEYDDGPLFGARVRR
jgi:uncharacterized protein